MSAGEVKLLTEAEWERLMVAVFKGGTFAVIKDELRERGLIAPAPVDPLLVEAREVCAKWCEAKDADCSAARYRDGSWDDATHMQVALAALRRGMELAQGGDNGIADATPPPPKWVQDSIPDWAFERVAQLVGYGDKHGPRGSRAGVAFARYLADNHLRAPLTRAGLRRAFLDAGMINLVSNEEIDRLHAALTDAKGGE